MAKKKITNIVACPTCGQGITPGQCPQCDPEPLLNAERIGRAQLAHLHRYCEMCRRDLNFDIYWMSEDYLRPDQPCLLCRQDEAGEHFRAHAKNSGDGCACCRHRGAGAQ